MNSPSCRGKYRSIGYAYQHKYMLVDLMNRGENHRVMKFKLTTHIIVVALSLLVARFCLAGALGPLGLNPNFSHLMTGSHQSVGEVFAITQDKKGFLWFGGRTGLARYDGYRFNIYTNTPNDSTSIGSNYINDVFEDSVGELWIATQGGGVARLNRELDNFHTYRYEPEINQPRPTGIFKKIYEDEHHNLWILGAQGIALYDREQDTFNRYLHTSLLKDETSTDMLQISASEYLFTTVNGVYLWERETNTIEKFVPDANKIGSLPYAYTRTLFKDSSGNIWIGHEQGLCRYLPSSKTFEPMQTDNMDKKLQGAPVWKITEDKNKILWLSTDGNGLVWFNSATKELGHYNKTTLPSSLLTPVVRNTFQDRAGDLWVSSFPIGINHFDRSNAYFSLFSNFIRGPNDIFINQVWAFSEDTKRNLWVGIDTLGLVYFDRAKNTFTKKYDDFDFSNIGLPNTILSIFEDSRGTIWLGSWAQGIARFNIKTKTREIFNPRYNKGSKFVGDSVWQIIESQNGDIIFATMNDGFIRYNYDTDSFTNFRHDPNNTNSINSNNVWSVFETKAGLLWIGTINGASVYDPKTHQFKSYQNDPSDPKSLSHNDVMSFFEDAKGRLWISTTGGGLNLFHPNENTFTQVRAADGLNSDSVLGMLEDNDGMLWVSTRAGLTAFNPDKFTFQNYTSKNWLQEGEFSHGSYLKLSTGELAFGGVNGFNIFDPKNVASNDYSPPIFFTELEILNKPVRPARENSPLKKDILESEKIILTYKESTFSLSFTAINYRVYNDNLYKYKLDGFDSDWHAASRNNKATYSHLDPGTYQFTVMASNNNNLWSDQSKTIEIIVLPAPWQTWWAYCFYIIAIFSCIAWYANVQRKKILHEKQINNRLVEVDKLKDDFLANTSHELRTPINGIIGLTEALQEGSSGPQTQTALNNLGMILACGRRLERLINDILDYSKSKKAEFTLEYTCVNSYQLIHEIVTECRPTIVNNAVKIINNLSSNTPLLYCDSFRTKHIFYNLLANAVKFTEFGSITISAEETDTQLKISIKDTGIGIAEKNLSQIYNSFTQLGESGVHSKNGTGLGLAISKYFVDAQGGALTVDSIVGLGSTFTVSLPKATAQQIVDAPEISATIEPKKMFMLNNYEVSVDTKNERPENLIAYEDDKNGLPIFFPKGYESVLALTKILVVDDETVNRMVLRHMLLKHNFVVYEACNGQEAVDAMHKGFKCDLILLDIMMPKMSGLEACKEIRTRYSLNELPIIFVSAKSRVDDLVECLNIEGNDFLSKPVNREELYARLDVHLKLLASYRKLEREVQA
jgi:two-component system, sensor histidine kinase ChiS